MSKKPLEIKPETGDKARKDVSYSAKDIYVLEGLEPVRKRPGMYIGSTGVDGLHHLVWEVVDNSIDEAMAGYAKNVTVELLPDGKVSVTDDGRGIPVEMHAQTKKSALETVLTTLHAGGKFGGESYKVAGGLHGVGVSVVNALSEWLRVEVSRDGGLYMQEYAYGKPKAKVKKIGTSKHTGTKTIFAPDPKVFSTLEFNAKVIMDHFRQQAYLTKGVRINFYDLRKDPPSFYGFYFNGGLLSFVKYLADDLKHLQEEIFYAHRNYEKMEVEAAFLYVNDLESKELSFANNIYTSDGGMHLTGFRSALTRTLNTYARTENYLKEKDENLTSEDTLEGLIAVVSVKLREPQFEGQTKARLGNPDARTAVEKVVNDALKEFLEKHPREARAIIEKVLLAAKARKAARAAKDTVLRKGAFEGLTLPGKLADCSSKNAAESELFIVEGDSAGGCFSGDTKVALADGRNISFEELVIEHRQGKKNYCYTVRDDGEIAIAPLLHPRRTKTNANVVRVVVDNGDSVVCTPDHLFMLRDGSYKKAKDLSVGDSLMPLYRKYSELGGKVTIEETSKTEEAAVHYNHKVVSVISLKDRMDVYDLEVEGTHNFALASGVFVHNSAKSGRDRRTQAILPLRGKILNVEKARLDKMLANQEIRALVVAVGTAIAENFDIEKLRYHKIVIMSDADVDGAHIRTLLLTLFYRYFPKIIEGGFLYIAQPPLFQVRAGREIRYAFDEAEKEKLIKELQKIKAEKSKDKGKKGVVEEEVLPEGESAEGSEGGEKIAGITIQRYKGLGEMNPEQLWATTMNPEHRVLIQVVVEDAERASKLMNILMGDDVEPRKQFIQTHAAAVQNLDV